MKSIEKISQMLFLFWEHQMRWWTEWQVLELGPVNERVYINDVATEFEIQQLVKPVQTRETRNTCSSLELKKDFSGFLLDPLQIFKRKAKGHFQKSGKVRCSPPFSYNGKYTISDYAIYQVVNYIIWNG